MSNVVTIDLILSTCSEIIISIISMKYQPSAELACKPSCSGENLFCVPRARPTISIYVTNAITGMYISGALTSSLGGTASD
jgi:hypothetical protein